MTSLVSKIKQPGELLNHILDQAELPAIVQRLDARTLTKLIRYLGLEDSATIVSLTTSEQLEGVLDEDLWYSEAPGQDEIFDADRFGLWLEIMEETGSEFAARKVLELDENLVILGLCRLVRVAGLGDATLRASDDWQPVDGCRSNKIWDGAPNHTFGSYRVIAKNQARWNAVFSLLVELNELDFDRLTRLLDRCRLISQEYIEENGGLFHVLSAEEMLAEDVSAERQERKEGRGFVTPTSAEVFLRQSRSTTLKKIIAAKIMDHGSRAYLKSAKAQADAVGPQTVADSSQKGPSGSTDLKVRQFVRTLRDAEVLPASDLKMLSYGGAGSWEHHLPLAKAMRFFNQSDPDLYSQRLTELSYLSNVLIAGCGFKGRTFQPQEAAEAAFSICNLGSEYLLKQDAGSRIRQPIDPMTALLKRHHLVKLFQLGWKNLFEHVVLYTAKAVSVFILLHRKAETADPDQVSELTRMFFMLRYYILSGQPWEFVESMDYLQIFLDSETIAALTELLQEHPTLPDVICKKGRHRRSPFIWSHARIRTIRRFLRDAL